MQIVKRSDHRHRGPVRTATWMVGQLSSVFMVMGLGSIYNKGIMAMLNLQKFLNTVVKKKQKPFIHISSSDTKDWNCGNSPQVD